MADLNMRLFNSANGLLYTFIIHRQYKTSYKKKVMSVFPIFISLHIEKYETISAQTKENLSFFVFLSQYARFYAEAKKNN